MNGTMENIKSVPWNNRLGRNCKKKEKRKEEKKVRERKKKEGKKEKSWYYK